MLEQHSLEQEIFQIARSQLISQREDLRNLRNQASISAALNALIATVFATLVGPEGFKKIGADSLLLGLSLEEVFIFATFFFSVLYAMLVLSSWAECTFDFSPGLLMEMAKKSPDTFYRKVSTYAERYFEENEHIISSAQNQLWRSLALALFHCLAWIYAII